MKRGAVIFSFKIILAAILAVFITSQTLAQSIDAPIKTITHYAEEYEIGNINYAQLIVYMASSSKELAEEMGAASQDHDSILKQEQLEKALGKPTETTRWVWVENEDQERKLDNEVPAWRKIIFDGRKIQVYLNAWPNIRTANNEDKIVYRLHNDISFKSQEEEINIKSEIESMKLLAQDYSSNPTKENLEKLAKESVSIEQIFNNNQDKNAGKCEELMDELFGSENKRSPQKILLQEINFFEGDNFQAKIRLEICDECEWHWINMNMWFESRGRFQSPEENRDFNENSRDKYSSLSNEDFEEQTQKIISEVKEDIEKKDYESASSKMGELRGLTEAWNEKANNVGQQIEKDFRVDFESMTQEEREECSKNYCWIKKEQERREAENQLKNSNYEQRKQFYLNLFSEYEKKESYSSQEQWERRLFEQFKEFGEEICDNNVDDNNNQQVDCSELQCGGKLCGYGTVTITDETNSTHEEKRELYCIQGSCQAKQEAVELNKTACGNNICEENEQETCSTDCAICAPQEALECAGTVIFSGKDANSCALEPICLTEDLSCETDNDCADPLCGDSSCVEGTCQLAQLTECREAECTDGAEKIQDCVSGEKIVVEKCIEGLWKSTELKCEVAQGEIQELTEEVVGNVCTVKSDCGNENDVCSNGKCITIPETIHVEEDVQEQEDIENEERQEEPQENEQEVQQSPDNNEQEKEETQNQNEEREVQPQESPEANEETAPITGNTAFYFFSSLLNGFATEGEETPAEESQESQQTSNEGSNVVNSENQEQRSTEGFIQQSPENNEENFEEQENRENQDGERENENRENQQREEERGQECSERCGRECYDGKVRPCVEKYIRDQCGNELKCNIDEVRVAGEEACKSNTEIESCVSECSDKCLAGENTRIESNQKDEHKEEKFVFTVGGACRQEQERLESSIWFGGWGEDFRDFHLVKEKYFTHGSGDWCEREYNNLITQRQELEKSMNEEFASWFFEKYVANSAEDWEKHISGIFDLYWRDVDISRQLAEKSQCLGKNELPPHNLINLKYETEYGKIEFWEEIKTVPASSIYGGAQNNPDKEQDNEEVQLISPYMKTYLFPSRDFFKLEMKKAMEAHRIPGPSEKEVRNTPTQEQKQRLIEDDAIERIREFNNEFGENIVIQFKDTQTGEVAF
ncbi:MAG TPA: hypothetical protein VJK03_01045, partial [Candidatus Nanoarchaeia archaeon]|nr:hypothetical protein [Candidatus Nanoarchaeia archaeon]